MINNKISHSLLQINTNLEIIAATIHYPSQNLTICSVYLPPGCEFPEAEFKALTTLLPQPFLILGDTNSKHRLWGSPTTDQRGSKLAKILEDKTLHTLNTGNP